MQRFRSWTSEDNGHLERQTGSDSASRRSESRVVGQCQRTDDQGSLSEPAVENRLRYVSFRNENIRLHTIASSKADVNKPYKCLFRAQKPVLALFRYFKASFKNHYIFLETNHIWKHNVFVSFTWRGGSGTRLAQWTFVGRLARLVRATRGTHDVIAGWSCNSAWFDGVASSHGP